jgi:hypothetical protein
LPDSTSVSISDSRGAAWEFINVYNGVGCLFGIGAGVWAATTPRVQDEESMVLLAVAGAAVGLLAVTLTAMTLVIVFLEGFFGQMIDDFSTRRFFLPFVVVAFVSAVDAVVSFAGAVDSGGGSGRDVGVGPEWTRDLLFGVAAWLLVWAIAGVCKLVLKLVTYGVDRAKTNAAIARSGAATGGAGAQEDS